MGKKESTLTIAFVSIFILSLILRLWFNFCDIHANAAFAFDAAEYLRYAQNIDSIFSKLFSEPFSNLNLCFKALFNQASLIESAQVKDLFNPLRSMSISGPVFPAFIFACYKLFGKTPSFEYWMIPVFIQCILTSLVPVLLMAIGNNCWNKKTGIIAGILAAIYPGFIVGSGRLYSESFACFLICFILWLITSYFIKSRMDMKSGFLLGILLFALQMTRSIMIALSFGILILLFISCFLLVDRRMQIIKYLLAVITGLAFCLLPWLTIQKLATGKASIIVDRVSNYNLLVGNDVDGLGWLSIPYQDCSKTDQDNYGHIMKSSISRSPQRWLKLMLDKPVRLFKLPWNDFKTSIGIISPFMQTIFHQLILVCAAIGLILNYVRFNKNTERQKIISRSIILLLFLFHFVYLFFITLPRYAITAMPEVLLFAGAGLTIILNGFKSRQSIPATIKLVTALILFVLLSKVDILRSIIPLSNTNFILTKLGLLLSILFKLIIGSTFFIACWQMFIQMHRKNNDFQWQTSYAIPGLIAVFIAVCMLPAYCLPLRAHGRWYEWSLPFDKTGQKIERVLQLNKNLADELSERGAYLAINLEHGSNLSTSVDVAINNVQLDNPIIPAMAVYQNLNLVNLNSNSQLTIEQEFIFDCLCNVSSKNPLDLRQWYLVPVSSDQWHKIINAHPKDNTILHITLRKNANANSTIYGAYPTDALFSFMPSLSRFSWEKTFYSAESESGFNDPFYDEKIARNSIIEKKDYRQLNQTAPGLYIKLLVPQINKIALESTTKIGAGKATTEANFLRIIDKQYQETDSNSECLLSFQSKAKIPAPKDGHDNLCLIRLSGEINQDGTERLIPIASVHFSKVIAGNKQADLSYKPVWLPTYSNVDLRQCSKPGNKQNLLFKNSPLRFDYCFPILLSAFPGYLDRIELYRSNNTHKNVNLLKNAHIKCSLQTYQMPGLLEGEHYEVF